MVGCGVSFLMLVIAFLACLSQIAAHGYLAVPVSRNLRSQQQGTFWDVMSGNGLGLGNTAGPGVCGDPFQGTNSNFAASPTQIQATYNQGSVVQLEVILTANHGGKFYFRVCPRSSNLDEECFGSNYLTRVDNGQRDTWLLTNEARYTMTYQLPPTVSCDTGCVLQWKYFAMQSCIEPNCDRTYCGAYADGVNAVYGGRPPLCDAAATMAEFFANCADIRIVPNGASSSPPAASPSPVSVPSPSPSPVQTTSPSPAIPPPNNSLLPLGPLNVAYYETWSAVYAGRGADLDLARIPGYINVVILSFAQPDCQYTKGSLAFSGTGLQFSSPGSVVKEAIAALKSATGGNTKVLLAVGGATYHNWGALNTQCIRDIVQDFGLDGVDIDYELTPSCSTSAGVISCSTDQQLISVTAALRMEFPMGQYILSTATWHVGMYGEGAFTNAQPTGSTYKGVNLALAKSGAGQQLDLINIMAYDAGNIQTTGFNAMESYLAHRVHWKTQAVALGVQVPPEAWGGNVITLPEVTQRALFARDNAGGAPYGIMLWSLHKSTACPHSQQIAQTICSAYNLGNCAAPLPVRLTATCGQTPASPSPPSTSPPSGSPPSPPPSSPPAGSSCSSYAVMGGACGAAAGGVCCSAGQCCSQHGWCGVTDNHCLPSNGCQVGFGSCTGVPQTPTSPSPSPPPRSPSPSPSPAQRVSPSPSPSRPASPSPSPSPPKTCSKYTNAPGGACGAASGCCLNNQCCSKWGWCGTTDTHCKVAKGCQALYGRCS